MWHKWKFTVPYLQDLLWTVMDLPVVLLFICSSHQWKQTMIMSGSCSRTYYSSSTSDVAHLYAFRAKKVPNINAKSNRREGDWKIPPLWVAIINRGLVSEYSVIFPTTHTEQLIKRGTQLTNCHLTTPSPCMCTLPFTVALFPCIPLDVPEKYRWGYFLDLGDVFGWTKT